MASQMANNLSAKDVDEDHHGQTTTVGPGGSTGYLGPNGSSAADLNRQISVTLTAQQFEGEWWRWRGEVDVRFHHRMA